MGRSPSRLVPLVGAVALGALTLAACRDDGGVAGIEGGALPRPATVPGQAPPVGPTTSGSVTGGTLPPFGSPPSPPTTTSPPSPPTPPSTGGPASPALVLGGDDLGVTRVGAPFRDAVAALTAVLGRPTGDPAADASCVGAADETAWAAFRLGGNDGKVTGWVSRSTSAATPSGVKVGSTLADLRRAYGARLKLQAATPDSGPLFEVEGADLAGGLSGTTPSATIGLLFNGTCAPP